MVISRSVVISNSFRYLAEMISLEYLLQEPYRIHTDAQIDAVDILQSLLLLSNHAKMLSSARCQMSITVELVAG